MNDLTPRQAECLEAIRKRLLATGLSPTLRELGADLGLRSTNGVNDLLVRLERKGYIVRESLRSRTIRLVQPLDSERDIERQFMAAFRSLSPGLQLCIFKKLEALMAEKERLRDG